MSLLPSSPKDQKLVALALVPVLIAVAYWHFIDTPARREITDLKDRLELLERKNAAARTAAAAQGGPELEKRLAIYEQHMSRLEQLIPNTEEVPELLHAMTLRAQENNVDLARMRPEAELAGDYYTRQTFDVIVIGAYHDVGRFLTAVGSLPRIVTPVDLKLSARNETDKNGQMRLEAQFRIQTYVLPSTETVERRPDAQT
ncbi:MAG TPA: type 4a pilus biogenesis protein PilO [Longimicrobiales bacterium]|nr:type 4a pilus biogenesis protein PilO [Longimicrobiales bacterium]